MKRIVISLGIFILITAGKVNSQTSGSENNSTTICSIVKEGSGGRVSKKAPLILHMRDSSTNKDVEIVFTKLMRRKMSYDPYDKLVNQLVCVDGKITSYNNMRAIVITSEEQIKKRQ